MLLKSLLMFAVVFALVASCSNRPGVNIDAEPALAVLGGAVLATQGEGRVAYTVPVRSPVDRLLRFIHPFPDAFAAPDCGAITAATCNANVMTVHYNNCRTPAFGRSGLWHSYFRYTFPTPLDCTDILTNGFDATGAALMAGKTVTRTWGEGAGGNQNNIRVSRNNEVAFIYSDYPSGWKDDRTGGVDITFETATRRRIVVQGVHARGFEFSEAPVEDPDVPFDLTTIDPTPTDDVFVRWDHTINTVRNGDPLFSLGPEISLSGGTVQIEGLSNDTTASFDGDIIVDNVTVRRGAALRVQHNLSQSVGVVVVTEPLVYSDSDCCWPMSGTVRAEYDRNLRAPTLEETIIFTGESCGAIRYTTTLFRDEDRLLGHCF